MKAYVCVKHVPDTAASISIIGGKGFDESVKFIINPYDEYAIEEAVQLVSKQGGEVVLLSVGKEAAAGTLRSALAVGPDRAVLVKIEDQFLDSLDTAAVLKKVIEQEGAPDIIFAGKQAVDNEGAQTCHRLGAALGLPVVTDVGKFALENGKVVVEREIGGGEKEVLEMTLPCIVGATKGLNTPRYPKLPDIIKAKKKEIKQISLKDLKLELSHSVELMQLETVPERSGAKILEGSVKEAVQQLVKQLSEVEKVLE